MRHPLLQHLHHRGGRPALRLAEDQVHVLRHHHIADDKEAVPASHLLQDAKEQIAASRTGQEGSPPMTAEGDEVKMPASVEALESARHARNLTRGCGDFSDLPPFASQRVGHPTFSPGISGIPDSPFAAQRVGHPHPKIGSFNLSRSTSSPLPRPGPAGGASAAAPCDPGRRAARPTTAARCCAAGARRRSRSRPRCRGA